MTSSLLGLWITAFICLALPGQDAQSPSGGIAAAKTERFVLENGLEVVLVPFDSAGSVVVNIWYHVGADEERTGQRGLAHLVEHLMFEGSANFAPGEHIRRLREMQVATFNAHTGRHRTRFFTALAPSGLDTLLRLEADRMSYSLPGLTRRAFEKERAVVLRERRERVDLTPYGPADAQLWKELFPLEHSYHYRIEGLANDLARLTFEDAREFIRRWYGPSNATLVILGDFDPGRARALVARHFDPLPRTRHRARRTQDHAAIKGRRLVRHLERRAKRPLLLVGWHAPGAGSEDFVLAALTAEALGGFGNGLLQERLVHELGLASHVTVNLSAQAGQSVFRVRLFPRRGVPPEELLLELDRALFDIAHGQLTEPDALRAVRRLVTKRAQAVDGSRGLVELSERLQRMHRGLEQPGCVPPENLRAEHIERYVRDWLSPDRSAVIVATPVEVREEGGPRELDAAESGR